MPGINYKIFVGEAYVGPAENRKIWLKAAEENRALLDGRVKMI